jgi:hypothetical protein
MLVRVELSSPVALGQALDAFIRQSVVFVLRRPECKEQENNQLYAMAPRGQ